MVKILDASMNRPSLGYIQFILTVTYCKNQIWQKGVIQQYMPSVC
jgi:hypothetical protein